MGPSLPVDPHAVPSDVDARWARGVQVGDQTTQINYFLDRPRPVSWPVRVGVIPPLADGHQLRASPTPLTENAPTVVLSGLGGVGKTQWAAELARARAAQVDLLVWITASSRAAIIEGYSRTAVELGHHHGDAQAEASWLLTWLQGTDRTWLIVLDDLADPVDLRGLWPDGPGGQTLVTTRRADSALSTRRRHRIDVETFTPEQARRFLIDRLGLDPSSELGDVDLLAADLGHLPLALAQAASFIADRGETCAGYLRRLADRRRVLADLFPPDAVADDYISTVAATWLLSVEAADRLPPRGLARPLLEQVCVFDPNGCPSALVTSFAADQLAMTVRPGAPADDLRDALRNLVRLSLVSLGQGDGTDVIRIHALVQRATLDGVDPQRRADLVRAGARALVAIWPEIDRDAEYARMLRSNATAVFERDAGAVWAGHDERQLLWRLGRSIGESGQYSAGIRHWEMVRDEAERRFGGDHPSTLSARWNLGEWLGEAGRHADAVAVLEKVVADQQRVLGPEHPDVLHSRGGLVLNRGSNGDPAGAAAAFEELLRDCIEHLGPDDAFTLTTRYNVASWRGEAGDVAGALAGTEELLADRLRVLGADHRHTLFSRAGLADWRGKAGDHDGAIREAEQLVRESRRALGARHPQTLAARGMVAWWRGESGDAAAAIDTLTPLLAEARHALGGDHPVVLGIAHNLVVWRGETGDFSRGVAEAEVLLTDSTRVLGPEHRLTLETRHRLAELRGRAGDVTGAITGADQLLADATRALGPDHPLTWNTGETLTYWNQHANTAESEPSGSGPATA
ncbi:tetratricopeptide repeat protein [Pseudonocardia sp. DSM 110487]|uniref:tetratricopeptide repeat protein n=1 Tax=Pseudonocardia sp. DSM 110487 TaxID=2865833 RepID=UPI001C699C9B|nr:tetratricopeptide repeat protein [Pseudonocardia sp. DSM 110487]QYN39102.1 tetratricopeptide repeat protein [Pseudonocardia sp. DSM 110487]